MRKKNDRVILPLAIPKSCDIFEQINVGCQATYTHQKKKKKKKEERKEREALLCFDKALF